MNENKFWLTLWFGCIAAAVILAICLLLYNVHENKIMADLISKGYDPIVIKSTFDAVDNDTLVMHQLVKEKNENKNQ